MGIAATDRAWVAAIGAAMGAWEHQEAATGTEMGTGTRIPAAHLSLRGAWLRSVCSSTPRVTCVAAATAGRFK